MEPAAVPRWYRPTRLLAIFAVIQFLVYLDRGIISSNGVNGTPNLPGKPGTGIQGEFSLTYLQDGLLPTAFMVGLMAASLLFSHLASTGANAFKLVGVGMSIWAASTLACGCAQGFWSLLLARTLVGAGEASVCSLTDPFVAAVAPPARRTLWFAAVYTCSNIGYPAGYIFGGVLGEAYGWRAPFFAQAAIGAPLALFALLGPTLPLDLADPEGTGGGGGSGTAKAEAGEGSGLLGGGLAGARRPASAGFARSLAALGALPLYVLNVLGSAAINAVLGAYSYWGPKVVVEVFGTPPRTVDLALGLACIFCGVAATLLGGAYLDRLGFSMRNAMLLNGGSVVLACVVLTADILLAPSFPVFVGVFVLGMLAVYFPCAPAAGINMWAVPAASRPLASAVFNILTHLLGDVPSPPLFGWLQERVFHNWRATLTLLNAFLLVAAGLYAAGAAMVTRTRHDYSREGLDAAVLAADGEGGGGSGGSGGGGNDGMEQPLLASPEAPSS